MGKSHRDIPLLFVQNVNSVVRAVSKMRQDAGPVIHAHKDEWRGAGDRRKRIYRDAHRPGVRASDSSDDDTRGELSAGSTEPLLVYHCQLRID